MLLFNTYFLLFLLVIKDHIIISLSKELLKHILSINDNVFEAKDLRNCDRV